LIRIGTRGSTLAVTQANWVAERFDEDTEVVTVPSSESADDKSRWVSGLERALLEDRIDVAVHSAKDVPAELPDGLQLVAFPPREDPRDAICGAASVAELRAGARVGTSSLRRAAQLRATREDLEVVSVRGNVDTRLRKLQGGEWDALVLAAAGLTRLGHQPDGILEELVPAAGQGALALESKADIQWPAAVTDPETTACVLAEREVTRALEASCNTAIGVYARRRADGQIELQAWVGRPDGSAWLRDQLRGPADEVGREVAQRMLSAGAAELV
jgi:hydroxymethylbilane synthase